MATAGTPAGRSKSSRRQQLAQVSIDESDDPMLALKWYHPHLSRHAADCMLIDNAPEGSYLLRPSSDENAYVLSVKLSSSVQHIKVTRTLSNGYRFGNSSFATVESIRKHFEIEKPVIGGDSGVTVILKFPYSRYVKESHLYTDVVHHAVTNMIDSDSDSFDSVPESGNNNHTMSKTVAVSSREGYLTKQGRIRKSWRVRWFVLRNYHLSYYKTKQSQKPISMLNLLEASNVDYDDTKHKEFCFRLEFNKRTYYFYANSIEDREQWVELLRSKLPGVGQ